MHCTTGDQPMDKTTPHYGRSRRAFRRYWAAKDRYERAFAFEAVARQHRVETPAMRDTTDRLYRRMVLIEGLARLRDRAATEFAA